MLYITTRDKYNASTVAKSLKSDRGVDGGLYIPFQLPSLSGAELAELTELNFGQCVSRILNLFFGRNLSGWDVEFSIGRYPTKVRDIRSNILVAELWHNEENTYERLEAALIRKLLLPGGEEISTSWVRIAVRISVLFALYGQMRRSSSLGEKEAFDVCMPTEDFSCAMAVWYARQMGLPVTNIICGCNENGGVWELLHQGQVRTDMPVVNTAVKRCDIALPEELERLICATLGQEEAWRYANVCSRIGIYFPTPVTLEVLRKGVYAAVISGERLQALIPNIHSTTGYLMGPYAAMAYGGLLDYRTRYRENRPALLIADRSPVCDAEFTAAAMHLAPSQLKEMV